MRRPVRLLHVLHFTIAVLLGQFVFCSDALSQRLAQNRSLVYAHVYEWWAKSSKEPIEIDLAIRSIGLRGGEVAYISQATFPDRGRNDFFGAVLIRPSQQEVRDISEITKTFEIKDLDNDGVSEIFTDVSGSGQGSTYGNKAIIQFDGWDPVVLRKIDYEDHGGAMVDQSISVAWHSVDVPGGTALIEQVDKSENGRQSTTIAALKLRDGAFVPIRENIVIRWPSERQKARAKNQDRNRLERAYWNASPKDIAKAYQEVSVKPELPRELAEAVKAADQASQDAQFNLNFGIKAYSDVLDKAPWWTPGYVRKARLYAALGQYRQALAETGQYKQLEPNDAATGGLGDEIMKWESLAESKGK